MKVVDCIAAILLGNPNWTVNKCSNDVSRTWTEVRLLLKHTAPKFVLVSDIEEGDYGYHDRRFLYWNFICVLMLYVDLG